MGLERTSDNFDINAILSAVNGGDGDAPPQARYGTLLDDMDREEAARLGLDNPGQLAIIRDISSMIEELQSNRSAGAGNELEGLITRIGGALPPGMSSAAANAIMIEVERRDRFGNGASFNNDEWDRIKDEVKKEREAQARAADFAEDAQNSQLSTTPDRYGLSQQNYAELNDELKTRDGQDRFMNFLRMMNPDMSDADLRRYVEDAQTIAAVRSNQATPDQRRAYEGMSPARRDEVSRSMRDFQAYEPAVAAASDANVENIDGSIEESFDQARTTYDSGGPTRTTSIPAASSLATPPISVASTLGDRANGATALSLTSTFRSAASPDQPAQAAMTSPAIAPQLAANTVDVGLANM